MNYSLASLILAFLLTAAKIHICDPLFLRSRQDCEIRDIKKGTCTTGTGFTVYEPTLNCNVRKTTSSADADNRLDAFSGQSRSTNMVPFHMLHIVSYCAIVTVSLRRAVFTIFVFKKFHDLEMGSKVTQNAVTLKTGLGLRQGHWKYHHVIEHL